MSVFGWCFGCGGSGAWNSHVRQGTGHRKLHGNCPGAVWPAVRVHDQAEADRLVPELLSIEAPGHVLEWVPGRGPIDFSQIPNTANFAEGQDFIDALQGFVWTCMDVDYCDTCSIDHKVSWLLISSDPDSPPVDVEDIRAVVGQCRAAGVPLWIDTLPKLEGWAWALWSKDPANMSLWPSDLPWIYRRELPEVQP